VSQVPGWMTLPSEQHDFSCWSRVIRRLLWLLHLQMQIF